MVYLNHIPYIQKGADYIHLKEATSLLRNASEEKRILKPINVINFFEISHSISMGYHLFLVFSISIVKKK